MSPRRSRSSNPRPVKDESSRCHDTTSHLTESPQERHMRCRPSADINVPDVLSSAMTYVSAHNALSGCQRQCVLSWYSALWLPFERKGRDSIILVSGLGVPAYETSGCTIYLRRPNAIRSQQQCRTLYSSPYSSKSSSLSSSRTNSSCQHAFRRKDTLPHPQSSQP